MHSSWLAFRKAAPTLPTSPYGQGRLLHGKDADAPTAEARTVLLICSHLSAFDLPTIKKEETIKSPPR